MTIFLGIDPGLRKTGWGVIVKKSTCITYIASGIIKTSVDGKKTTSHYSDAKALGLIYQGIHEVMTKYQVFHCAIENTYVNSNPISSLKLAQARATAIIACYNAGSIPHEYPASTIKKVVTGRGNADKSQVQKMLSIQLGHVWKSNSTDETDALAIALCHALHHRSSHSVL